MTEELTKEQLTVLKKAFDSCDREKCGAIRCQMVGSILRLLGQTYSDKVLKELIREVDPEGKGKLTFPEFILVAAKFIVEEDADALQKELKEAFRLYDKEGNGFIPTSSLREILRELDDQLTAEDLDNIIAEIDTDRSGTVDFDEFMEMMTG